MKELEKYLLNREYAIGEFLELPKESFTPDTFHDLRVEIKKLNALFELLEYCDNDFKRNRSFKPFRPLFRQAGKVRGFQVEEELLQKHFSNNIPSHYLQKSAALKNQDQLAFFQLLIEVSPASLDKIYRHAMRLLTMVHEEKVRNFLKKRGTIIGKHLKADELSPDQIHGLRKQLKTYVYIANSVGPVQAKEATRNKVDLPDLLGKWHDWHVLGANLEMAQADEGPGQEERSLIAGILIATSSEKERLMLKIKTAFAASEFIATTETN